MASDGAVDGVLNQIVQAAHHHLALDAVYISRLTAEEEIYEAAAGDAGSFGISVGWSRSRAATLCHRVVGGELPSLITDVGEDPRTFALVEEQIGLGAYLGVPLLHSDGSVYGIVCGLGHHPDPSLDDRDVRFMSLLAELLTGHVDQRRERDELTKAISEVINQRKLTIVAQPVIDLRDGHCLGIEALSRFRAPFSRPDHAFAAATSVGLGVDLEALAVQRAWELLPELAPDQFLSINLSPAAATKLAARAHARVDLPLSQLVIELTEHAAVDSYSDLRNRFRPLREAGLRVAVADAGAGYASLAARRRTPPRLRQDRS